MKNKSSKHWIILLLCCGLAAASIGVSINTSGVFYTPVAKSLNIMRGTFAMHMTIFSIATAIGSLFVAKAMKKVNYKIILIISVAIAVITTGLMAYTTSVFGFYVLGAIRGFSTVFFSAVPLTIIINNWFVEKHGLVTSIALGFSGIAGSIFSPIFASIISEFGWQTGYLVKAIIILCLCLPAIIYPFHLQPRMDNLLPYGYVEEKTSNEQINTTSFRFVNLAFVSFFIFGLLCSCITSITQHLPGYGQSLGYSSAIGATLLSAGMIGNISFKLMIGFLSDRLGAIKATFTMITINILGIVLLLIGNSEMLLISGAFLFGACYSIGAVALPLLTKHFFGNDNYSQVFPTVSFASNFGAALSLSIVGYIYDFFGSYLYAFILALIMIVICVTTLVITLKAKR